MLNLSKRILLSPISIRLLSVLFGFIGSVLVNRALGLELRGEYTTIYTYANLLQTVLNFGIAYAIVPLRSKFGASTAKRIVTSFTWMQFCLCLVGSILFLAISFSMQNLFICLLMSLMVLNSQVVFIALIENIRSRNLTLLLSSMLYVIANTFILLFFQKHLYAVLGCLAAKMIFETVVCARKQGIFHFSIKDLTLDAARGIAKYGLSTAVLAALITCNYNIDVVVLNVLNASDYELGIFGVAFTLSNMLWFIPDAFKEYIYSKSAEGASEAMTLVLIAINMLICACICVGFLFLGKPFLSILYGEEFVAAFNVTLTIFIGIIPMIAFKLIHPIYVNKGQSLSVAVLLLVAVVLNCIIAWQLIPSMGAYGAALATVLAYTLCGTMFFVKFVRDYKLGVKDFIRCAKSLLG